MKPSDEVINSFKRIFEKITKIQSEKANPEKKTKEINILTHGLPQDLQEAINTFGRYGIPVPVECLWKVNGKEI